MVDLPDCIRTVDCQPAWPHRQRLGGGAALPAACLFALANSHKASLDRRS
jgi:hypothetical protein